MQPFTMRLQDVIPRGFQKLKKLLLTFFVGLVRTEKYSSLLLELAIQKRELLGHVGITTHERLLDASNINTFSDALKECASVGIVIQGGLKKEHDFTLQTIKIYRQHFPDAHIILSTWENEDAGYLNRIRAEGIDIVLSPLPVISGFNNINYQIVSSVAGIKMAASKNCVYVYKTRTDQRMYAPNINEYLVKLLEQFPITHGFLQKQRLVAVSLNTFKYRLYGISDMFMFGNTIDMLSYWDCPLDERTIPINDFYGMSTLDFAKHKTCEVYLFTNYLDKLGIPYHWTLKESYERMAEHFVVIDKESIDLYWPKYTRQEYRWLSYANITMHQEINFREWLILYAALPNKIINENELDKRFFDVVTNQ